VERVRRFRNSLSEAESVEKRKKRKRMAEKDESTLLRHTTPQTFGISVKKVLRSLPTDENRRKDVMIDVNKRIGLRVINFARPGIDCTVQREAAREVIFHVKVLASKMCPCTRAQESRSRLGIFS
jgi:hypothetical protein